MAAPFGTAEGLAVPLADGPDIDGLVDVADLDRPAAGWCDRVGAEPG